MIDLEVAYNHWAPFRFAWVLMLVACLCVLLQMGSGWKAGSIPLGLASYVAGMVAMLVGFFMRVTISGRAPVTNMYESVVYVGLGVAAIGLVLELIYRKRFIAVAAAAVSTVALILADNCPSVLDSSLQPLQPVLRNNFWLVIHVMTITLSYAAFALAMGIANITLGYYLVRSENRPAIEALSRFTYRALQVGVVLLATGTFLGGMWAAYSWGRFWGWDPKEVWALIALLGYLAVLHSRFAGWVKHRGLAALAVSCFALVIVAWYGVNFVLGAGLHSYGFGGGGKLFMGTLIGVQSLYVAAALWRSRQPIARGQAAPATCRHAGRRRFDIARGGGLSPAYGPFPPCDLKPGGSSAWISASRPQNLGDAPGVAAAFERRVQPDFDHAVDQPFAQQVGGEAEDVGVVVAAAHFGRQIVVAGGRADAGELVGRDAHSQAGAADQDAAIDLAAADLAGHPGGDVGIIDGLAGVRAHVLHLVAQSLQQLDDPRADGKTAMIGADSDTHVQSKQLAGFVRVAISSSARICAAQRW